MKAALESKTPAKPKFARIEIEPSENGGHTVTHHMKAMPMHSSKHGMMPGAYHEPEKHVFGEGEGHEMLAHVANHLGIEAGMGESEHEDEEGAEE